MLLLATLTVRRAELDAFRAYEHAAAAIMARHGGRIENAFVVDEGGDTLRELHVVRFASADDRARYAADPELRALAEIRERCVVSTEILNATDGPRYG